MRTLHFISRQIAASRHQSVLFVLCVALSLITLIALGGFSRSVHRSFLRDARQLHAGDIIIRSHSPLSGQLVRKLAAMEAAGTIQAARVHEFYSVVRTLDQDASLLANLKVVEKSYPFYGSVQLASGRQFREALVPGSAIVEKTFLDRLRLRIGDRIRAGSAVFVIGDVVTLEPDRPVNFFSLGPRVFIPAADLKRLELVGRGSRVNHTALVKVIKEADLERTARQLSEAAETDREQVETFRTARSGVKRFFDNFLFFLNLIGIFTLLLAGIGIQSSLTAFLKEQERTIAIMKAVGARSRFIMSNYFGVVLVLGFAGTMAGLGASFLLEPVLPRLFQGFLPAATDLAISGGAVAEGMMLGAAVVVLFTFLPIMQLKEVRPRSIFAGQHPPAQRGLTLFLAAAAAVFFFILVLWRIREVKMGMFFVIGLGLLTLISLIAASAALHVLRRRRASNLAMRQALRGLFRPRNATLAVIVTLTCAFAVIFSIALVEKNLDATFVQSYPLDSPNLFFLDIQRGQREEFKKALGIETIFYPVVRGTVLAVNNEQIDRVRERQKRGDNLAREFSLTYRESLLNDERIISGSSLFRQDWQGPQVSVLDTVLEMRDLRIGDVVTFRIQGLPVDARIASIRTRARASLQPFFYFVFQDEVLQDAPQTLFTALRLRKDRIAELQNRIAARFPNVSVIDVTETVSVFAEIMSRLSRIVLFFTLFSVAAGMLIIVSSIFATRYARIQEAVFFTILGGRAGFIRSIFAMENLVIGLMSSLIALTLAQTASWIICRKALDIPYAPFPGMTVLMVFAATFLVLATGLGASVPVLRKKPAAFLREQAEG